MRFKRIEITNYRQYRELNLSFDQNKDTDLHVVIASNGIGKTNLLNAIEWCLYGEETHLGDKEDSLTICNLDALAEAKAKSIKDALVSVTIYATDGERIYTFTRSVKVNVFSQTAGIDELTVEYKGTGGTKVVTDDAARDIVNSFLPEKIKQYFFFDGEQLFNYFGKTQSTTNVKDSIHEIAQINVVKHTREHLDTMINDKEKALSKLNPQTQKYQEELDDMISKKKQLEDDIEVLKAQMEDADEQIRTIDEQLAGTDQVAEYHKEQIAIEADIEKLSKSLEALEVERLSIIKTYYVLLMFYDSNNKTKGYIADKEAQGNLPPDIDRDLILKSIHEKKCAICNQEITDDIVQHFDELLEKFSVSSGVSNRLMEIKNDVIACCEEAEKYRSKREVINKEIRETEESIKTRKDREEELNRKMSGVSNIEDIEGLIEDKKSYKSLRDTNAEKIGNYREQINQKNTDIELKRAQIERATQQDEHSNNLKEQLIFLKAARDVVKSIEDEVVNEIKQRMEQETFSIFSRLIWKKNTYQRIEFSDTYKLKLFHVHGDSCLGSCSAAERELLALAFTLALHKVSHHDSLLFIDTPVGRVSDQNRSFFAKSIVEVSRNKQVILAFTPSEYSSEISECFDYDASSKATLKTTSEITTIIK